MALYCRDDALITQTSPPLRCVEELGIESVIPPVAKLKEGSIKTRYRSLVRRLLDGYRRRAAVESVFSAIKRTTGSRQRGCGGESLRTEAALKVLVYALLYPRHNPWKRFSK